MASYSISYTSTTITVRVTGLSVGDELLFFVRFDSDTGVTLVDDIQG